MFLLGPELFGLSEGFLETAGEGVELLSSLELRLLGCLSVGLDVGLSLFVGLFLLLELSGLSGGFIGVELLHESLVLEGVSLGLVVENGVGSHLSQLRLNLITVDDSGEISTGHDVSVEDVATLLDTLGSVVAEDVVEGLEGVSGPDDESAEVTTGGELEEVESVYAHGLNTGEVSGGSLHEVVLVTVDNEGSLSENVSGVSHLTVTNSNLSGLSGSLQFLSSAELSEGSEEGLGGLSVEVLNDEGKFGDFLDSVASGEDERSDSGGSDGGGNSMSLLVGVDLSVPSSVGLEGSEHSTLSAHVTEGTLT